MSERTFSVKEISEHLGVSRTTVYTWMNDGELSFIPRKQGKKSFRVVTATSLVEFSKETGVDVSGLVDRDQLGRVSPRMG